MSAGPGAEFTLTAITADPDLASRALAAGVERIGVDLEVLGKRQRQHGPENRMSAHRLDDLEAIAKSVPADRLFARTNPLNPGSGAEIDALVAGGVRFVMLPFFRTAQELSAFVDLIDGRAVPIGLVETVEAVRDIGEVAAVDGCPELMLGLNDLRLAYGMKNHFQVLVSDRMARACAQVVEAGKRLSIGGVTAPDHPGLGVDPQLVLAQYPRLGATGAWLARVFLQRYGAKQTDFTSAVQAIRDQLTIFSTLSADSLEEYRRQLAKLADGAGG